MTDPLPLATPSDLATWLGQTIASDNPRAVAVLAGASALVRAEAGQTWLSDAGDELDGLPITVRTVTVQCAARVWVNPQGLTRSDTADVDSREWPTASTQGLYLTAEERRILSRYNTSGRTGLWTLRTVRDDCYPDTTYVPVEGGADDFPWYSDDVDRYGLHP